MSRSSAFLPVTLALVSVAPLAGLGCHRADPNAGAGASGAPVAASPAEPTRPPSARLKTKLLDVPAFTFTDQDGKSFTQADLRGHVWIADYIFTHCTSSCPLLTSQLKLVQRRLAGRDVRFVSFSVDPEHDTPAALKAYAAQWHLDEALWRLIATPDATALRGFTSRMKTEVMQGDDPRNAILHSNSFWLIDAAGALRGYYDSTEPEDLADLVADARSLAPPRVPERGAAASTAPGGGSPAEQGRLLAEQLGCVACHAKPAVAPPLEGVAGSTVTLADGATVRADAAYLRESILDPQKKVVKGYGATMPGYRGQLTDAQVDTLLAFVTSLGSAAPASPQARVAAVDPICGMGVSAGPDSPQAQVDGTTYYFCSDACRTKFLADPRGHLPPDAGR
jgi:protein SCO1/2